MAMEKSEDIFADLLSGLQPSSARREPQQEDFVSMDETRRKAMSDGETDPLPVRRSDSPVGDNLHPPPPPLTKADVKEVVQESLRELLFQSFGALTNSLRSALSRTAQTTSAVEQTCQGLDAQLRGLTEKHSEDTQCLNERCQQMEQMLKETTVGVQRMLEKQDLLDAHVLLNRHAAEDKPKSEAEEMQKKSETRVSIQANKGPVIEEVEDTEEEEEADEEDPPVIVSKRAGHHHKARPVTYVTEAESSRRPVEHTTYIQREKPEVHHPPQQTLQQTPPPPQQQMLQPMQMPGGRPAAPQPYPTEEMALAHRPPQPTPYPAPGSQPVVDNRIPQQSGYAPPGSHPPANNAPTQGPPAPQPQQAMYPPSAGQQPSDPYKPQNVPYQYQSGENGFAGAVPPPSGAEKPLPHVAFPHTQPPPQFGNVPGVPPTSTQLPPPPQQPSNQYPSYPTLPPQQVYRPQPPSYYTPPPANIPEPKHTGPAALPKSSDTTSGHSPMQKVPLDQVINDVANMGFDRTKVRSVVTNMLDRGESVDLNVVIDRLMNMYH